MGELAEIGSYGIFCWQRGDTIETRATGDGGKPRPLTRIPGKGPCKRKRVSAMPSINKFDRHIQASVNRNGGENIYIYTGKIDYL
jgi:hypothetical protein